MTVRGGFFKPDLDGFLMQKASERIFRDPAKKLDHHQSKIDKGGTHD
jgi:hypothetical protein